MRIDTHVHTSPASRCSRLSLPAFLMEINEFRLAAACVTNHGDMTDYDELVATAPPGMVLIGGVEVSAETGDFIVFSLDLDFLHSLRPLQPLPPPADRPQGTVVVWAHPFAGIGGGEAPTDFVAGVAAQVDGIEVYNGNWPDEQASARAAQLASRYGLAQLGGSDTHHPGQLMRCYTEVEGVIAGPEDLITAIAERRTAAGWDASRQQGKLP